MIHPSLFIGITSFNLKKIKMKLIGGLGHVCAHIG